MEGLRTQLKTKAIRHTELSLLPATCVGLVFIFFGTLLLNAQSVLPVISPLPSPVLASPLQIAGGDLIEVSVFGIPEFSRPYRVSPMGDIDLNLGGRVHVGGLSPSEAALVVEKILRNQQLLLDPHVSVFVREYASQGVTIIGEIKNPGVYPALGEHKLYDLIAAAGGFTATASNKITILHHGEPQRIENVELSNLNLTDGQSDILLAPGDRVVVGAGGIVYVIGDVGRPGGFVLSRTDDTLTVLKILSLAQGINQTAKLGKATIITRTSSGLIHRDLNLKDILQHRAPDPLLAAGEVLYVPTSVTKVIGYRTLEAVFSAATTTAAVLASQR